MIKTLSYRNQKRNQPHNKLNSPPFSWSPNEVAVEMFILQARLNFLLSRIPFYIAYMLDTNLLKYFIF